MMQLPLDLTGIASPRLMPRKTWSRPPSAEELEIIPQWEEKYIHARAKFERYDARARDSFNENPDPISPEIYLKWLRGATQRYNERSAERDPKLRGRLKVTKARMAGLGYIDHPPRHGEVALTVGPHETRVRGEARGFMADGDRVHLHHSPKYEAIKGEVSYGQAISVGMGDWVHQHLHRMRDKYRANETRRQEVDGDFDWIASHMLARGYTAQELARARERMHDMNNDLGIYRA